MGAVTLPERFTDFANGGVGADGVDYVGHGVRVRDVAVGACSRSLGGGLHQGVEAAVNFFVRAAGAKGLELFFLSAGYRFADVENVVRLLFDDDIIYPTRDLLVGFNGALVLAAVFGN